MGDCQVAQKFLLVNVRQRLWIQLRDFFWYMQSKSYIFENAVLSESATLGYVGAHPWECAYFAFFPKQSRSKNLFDIFKSDAETLWFPFLPSIYFDPFYIKV